MSEFPKPLPGDRAHIERLLDAWSRDTDERVTAGRLRHYVGVQVIVQMLDGLRDAEGMQRLGFKGGSALELRYGFRARASSDLDGSYRGELAEAVTLISEAVISGWSGFEGTATEPELVTGPGLATPPVRFKVKLNYRHRPFITIPMELSVAEGRSLDEIEIGSPLIDLAPVQLQGANTIPFLPIRYQVAQKLHACTEDLGEEQPNQRVRDLPDLLLIEELGLCSQDLPKIRQACIEIFEQRARQSWPPIINVWGGWKAIWEKIATDENLEYSLPEAVERVQTLVFMIEAAVY